MSNHNKPQTRLLIVEDSPDMAELIQVTLEKLEIDICWVDNGIQALEEIQAQKPDMILLDIGLPDMSGWDILNHIHGWKGKFDYPLPKVIVISAHGDPPNRLIGKLRDIDGYLIKPFTVFELREIVEKALA